MKRFPWITGLILLGITLIGAGWAFNASPASGSKPNKEPQPISVVMFGKVDGEHGTMPVIPSQTGEVIAIREEREIVKEGDWLLKLDPTLAKLRLAEAELDLKSAEALLTKAEQGPKLLASKKLQQTEGIAAAIKEKAKAKGELEFNLKKAADLNFKIDPNLKGSLEADLDRLDAKLKVEQERLKEIDLMEIGVEADILRAKQEIESKKLQKEKAQYGLDKCEVKAPNRGMVLQVGVRQGYLITGQERFPPMQFLPLPKKAKDSDEMTIFVKAEIIQEWASRIKKGMKVEVQDDTYQGDKYEGIITRISPWMGQKRQIIMEPFMTNDQNTLECTVELTTRIKSDGSRTPLSTDDLLIGQRVRVIVSK